MTQIYKVGTATVSNGSATVEGTDTGWATALVTGGLFTMDGLSVPIESVSGEDELTLALPWPGEDGTGAYAIMRENSAASSVVGLYDRLRQAMITLSLHSIHPDFVGTLAEIEALDLTPEDTEFVAARLEDGQPDEYYRWGGTDWVGPFPISKEGPAGSGEDGANAYVYVAYASASDGTGFTTTFNPALDYIAVLPTDTEIETPSAGDFAGRWKNYKGAPGNDGNDGDDGEDGQDFAPDEVVALIADRDAFDDEPKMFAVLVESDAGNDDLPTLYFKLSGASADWSGGFTFAGGGGAVDSVNGQTGDVVLDATDILTDDAGTFEGASVEDVLDDHDGRIVDLEAGAVLTTDTDASGFGFVNSAGALGDSDEKLPSESVVKAYVDANAGAGPHIRVAQYGGVAAAHAAAGTRAVDYGDVVWPDDSASGYSNLYGATKYRSASFGRYQAGLTGQPVNDPRPVVAIQKYSSADRSTDAGAWDQGFYAGIQSVSGDAYRAAISGFARAMPGATGDHVGTHMRADIREPDARGYAGWAYYQEQIVGANAAAGHAIEVNGTVTNDPGYLSSHQLIRLCMADSAAAANRFGSAITIGKSTLGGSNGFHTGIHIDRDAIVPTVGQLADGEAIRIDAHAADVHLGGIRFSKRNAGDLGAFKYALRTDEATFISDAAILLGPGQRIRWGSAGPSVTAGSNHVTILGAFLHVSNPVGTTVMQAAGTRILSTQQAAIANATAGTDVATINSILAAMRAHGLIAT